MTNPTTKRSRGAARAWPILVALALAAGCDDGREDFERFVAERVAERSVEHSLLWSTAKAVVMHILSSKCTSALASRRRTAVS